jgi:excisionase family DNA binding protein
VTVELTPDQVATSEEVAEMLRVSRITVRTMVARGKLQPLKAGTRPLLFALEDVWEFQYRRRHDLRRCDSVLDLP